MQGGALQSGFTDSQVEVMQNFYKFSEAAFDSSVRPECWRAAHDKVLEPLAFCIWLACRARSSSKGSVL